MVDGPGDTSCDIIFQKSNFQKEEVYYVVQSKWNQEQKANSMIDSGEVKKALNDFQTILNGKKEKTENEKFNKSLETLFEHLNKNGKVEFLFFSLCKWNPDAEDNLKAFNHNNPRMQVRVIDIEQIKRDYIDVHYKKLEEQNLLERKYNPKEEEIIINLERLGTNNNQIIIQKPFDAMIILIRPKLLYELFEKFGYSLFIENVRNPIKKSEINKRMQETLEKNPAYFWYYNNGITAIAKSLPTVSKQAKEFRIQGLQIINGAQTVHAVHSVYSQLSSNVDQKRLDEEALLTLRIYKSGGEDFDRNVTKYTNAQNPMDDRDFWANDPIQIRLQNESFNTKYWYEKRRDEFVEKPKDVIVLSNKYLAGEYISFMHQFPWIAKKSFNDEAIDALFLSKKEDDHFGWYEYIFNSETKYTDILAADTIFYLIKEMVKSDKYYDNEVLSILGLFKPVFEKYLSLKYKDTFNCIPYILDKYEKGETSEIRKTILYIHNYIKQQFQVEFIQNDDLFLNKEITNLKVLLPNNLKLEDIDSIQVN